MSPEDAAAAKLARPAITGGSIIVDHCPRQEACCVSGEIPTCKTEACFRECFSQASCASKESKGETGDPESFGEI